MKILMLLELEFPPDDRVEKEAISLIETGNEVSLACYTMQGKPLNEVHRGIKIKRKPMSAFMFKSSAACLIMPYYFRFWRKFVEKLYLEEPFDAIHVHDLPLASVGYYMKRKYGVKLICDQHEYYSNWIVHTAHYNTLVGKVIKLFSNWKKI